MPAVAAHGALARVGRTWLCLLHELREPQGSRANFRNRNQTHTLPAVLAVIALAHGSPNKAASYRAAKRLKSGCARSRCGFPATFRALRIGAVTALPPRVSNFGKDVQTGCTIAWRTAGREICG